MLIANLSYLIGQSSEGYGKYVFCNFCCIIQFFDILIKRICQLSSHSHSILQIVWKLSYPKNINAQGVERYHFRSSIVWTWLPATRDWKQKTSTDLEISKGFAENFPAQIVQEQQQIECLNKFPTQKTRTHCFPIQK